jgi:hypothetical protein
VSLESACLKCPGCQRSENLLAAGTESVLFLGLKHRFHVQIPQFSCKLCEKTIAIKPLHVHCMPGSPVQAWSLWKRKANQPPSTWVCVQLCNFLNQAKLSLRRASHLKLWELLDITHHQNDPTLPPTSDSDNDKLRKQITAVCPSRIQPLSSGRLYIRVNCRTPC